VICLHGCCVRNCPFFPHEYFVCWLICSNLSARPAPPLFFRAFPFAFSSVWLRFRRSERVIFPSPFYYRVFFGLDHTSFAHLFFHSSRPVLGRMTTFLLFGSVLRMPGWALFPTLLILFGTPVLPLIDHGRCSLFLHFFLFRLLLAIVFNLPVILIGFIFYSF